MKSWKIDVAVLCIFFTRPNQFRETFNKVKEARPKTLLLYQDGPRKNNYHDDVDKINQCRNIINEIDWDCKVYKFFQDENYGCDPSTYIAHKWAFSLVSKCIILEDDIVVSKSFFLYCKELLDKYEYDTRINRICGMNIFGKPNNYPFDYFYSINGSVWGWATWRRVADTWDESYSFLEDNTLKDLLINKYGKKVIEKYYSLCKTHKKSGIPHWETIVSSNQLLNSTYNIIPSINLVSNIGISENATHASSNFSEIPKKLRKLFFSNVKCFNGALRHPPYLIENISYGKKELELAGKTRMINKIWLKMKFHIVSFIRSHLKND